MAREKVSDYSEMRTINFGEDEGNLGVGDEFAGYFKGVKVVNTKYGEKKVYTFQTETGEDVQIWGSAKLNLKMAQIGLGNMTYITYTGLGKKEKGKNQAKLFDVEQDKAKQIHVDVAPVAFREEAESSDDDAENDLDLPTARAPAARAAQAPSADRQAKMAALLGTKR